MLNRQQAMNLVVKANQGVTAVDCFRYEDILLVRIEHADPAEANFDPFFSVNPRTGEVKEFSILTDGDPVAIAKAYENRR